LVKFQGEEFNTDIYSSSYQEQMLKLAIQRHFETERQNFSDRKFKILDYFVVGDNRLHIIVDDKFTLRFKILEINGNTLRLQGPKGVMSFTKVTTSVQQVKAEQQAIEKARYNIKGQKIAKPERGINIIQMSDNSSRKEMVR